jgi:hypothetical protein
VVLVVCFRQEEADTMRGEVLRLNQQLKEANAKEFAMDSATKQNSELLKLLKKAEEETTTVWCLSAASLSLFLRLLAA